MTGRISPMNTLQLSRVPMSTARRVGLLLVVVAALAVMLVPGRSSVPGSVADRVGEHASAAEVAMLMWSANEDSTRGAPQQQVVNGWVARDLLEVIAEQNNTLIEQVALLRQDAGDNRTPWLIVLGLVAAALVVAPAWGRKTGGPQEPPVVS